LKCAGVPQTRQQISAASGPKFTILRGHVEEILLLNKFFPIVDICVSCEDIARQSCGMVPRWRLFGDFLHAVFSASRAQHVSDLHSKFTLRPHHVWKYVIQSPTAEIRRGNNERKKKKPQDEDMYGLPYYIGQP